MVPYIPESKSSACCNVQVRRVVIQSDVSHVRAGAGMSTCR